MKQRRLLSIARITFRCVWIICFLILSLAWARSYSFYNSISFTTRSGDDIFLNTLPGRIRFLWRDYTLDGIAAIPKSDWNFDRDPGPIIVPAPAGSISFSSAGFGRAGFGTGGFGFGFPPLPSTANDGWSNRHDLFAAPPLHWEKFGIVIDHAPLDPGVRPSKAILSALFGRNDLVEISVPLWMIEAILLLPIAWWTWRIIRARKRFKIGICQKCGYDLRATPNRCPECGTETSTSAAPR